MSKQARCDDSTLQRAPERRPARPRPAVPPGLGNIQEALDDAAGNADAENAIYITASPYFTPAEIHIGDDFSAAHRLVIRPAVGMSRATIASSNGTQPIIRMQPDVDPEAGGVTLQDLDLIRHSTNVNHLVVVNNYTDVVIERCRIGSDWGSVGPVGWNNLEISYPKNVVVRNCILFSYLPANFSRAIHATGFSTPDNSLLLYNNVAADYRTAGIHIEMGNAIGALILPRNNVVVNHPDAPAGFEPVAYVSGVAAGPTIVTSHNVSFASAVAFEETRVFGRSISGQNDASATNYLTFVRGDVDDAFADRIWNVIPAWDPNTAFYELVDLAPLHDADSDWGVTVANGAPHARDVAVLDDIEKEIRPGGLTPHTDRGADQIEPGVALAVGWRPERRELLWAAPRGNPSATPGVLYRAGVAGRLVCELLDLAGRRLHRSEREVEAGGTGVVECAGASRAGVLIYRLRLLPRQGGAAEASGRLVALR